MIKKSRHSWETAFDPDNNPGLGIPSNIDTAQEGIEYAIESSQGFPRAGIPLVSNGVVGNNDWITYNELTPNAKIIFPVNTRINELTMTNQNTSVESDFIFYKNGITAGNIIYTWSISTGVNDYTYQNGLTLDFNAGDWLRILHSDQGTNPSDLVLVLWISRII